MDENVLSGDEIDILQEIMNIAFGRAASDLAEVIDIYIRLSVPYIHLLDTAKLSGYIKDEIKDYSNISLVEQKFWGKFKGIALLIFPSGSGKKLTALLYKNEAGFFESDPIDELEKETLIEVGNILIGACVGKMAELLEDVVTFSPPTVLIENYPKDVIPKNIFDHNNTAIILKTSFKFEKEDVQGFLFLLTTKDSICLLTKALTEFTERFE